jgi:hypothetical protein
VSTCARRVVVSVSLVLACALTLGSASALAGNQFQLLRTLTLPPEDGGPFSELRPDSVAVDDFNHEIFVADSGTGLVQVLNASGEYVETWNGSNTPAKTFGGRAISIAADDATGRVYVMDSVDAVVEVLEASGEYVETWSGSNTPAQSFAPAAEEFGSIIPLDVAVNQANGHVLVEDREHGVIDVFGSTGTYLSPQMTLVREGGNPESISPSTDGLAVDDVTGVVLLTNEFGFVDEFDEESRKPLPPLTGLEGPTHELKIGISLGAPGASYPSGAVFFAGTSSDGGEVDVFDPASAYLTQFTPGGSGVSVDRGTGDVYVSHDEGSGYFQGENAVVNVFRNTTIPPVRPFPSHMEKKSGAIHVTLNGGVDPEGHAVTKCLFEYGPSEAYGSQVPCAQSAGEIGTGLDLVHVSAELPEPQSGATYDYRLVAESEEGQNESANEELHTPEALGVKVEAPSNMAKNGGTIVATLNGAVNPEGEAVEECYFEYGTSLPSGKRVLCEPPAAALGKGQVFEKVDAKASGLLGNTTYDYRLVAKNAIGTSSTGGSFETPVAVLGLTGCTASELLNGEATLHGSFEPGGIATNWRFEYKEAVAPTWSGSAEGSAPAEAGLFGAEALISGLEQNTSYDCRLTARNEYGTTSGPEGEFTTAAPPIVDGESFSAVGFSSVTLHAKINGFGARDSYRFEYGTSEVYGSSTLEASIAKPVRGEVGVFIPVSGLKPATTYYFRAVVTEPHGGGMAIGEEHARFTTFPETSASLPDGRTYEMVSPLEAQGADVYVPETGNGPYPTPTMMPFQASASGEAVAYAGAPSQGGDANAGAGGGNEYLARLTPEGWVPQNITPPGSGSPAYLAFSSDLSTGILESREPLAEEALGDEYDVLYAHATVGGGYNPLFSSKPPNRSPGEFESFGTTGPQGSGPQGGGLAYAGASADFSHLLFEANDGLSPEAEGKDPGREENDLYDSVGGQLSLVNVLPASEGGGPAPDATFGAPNESGEPADPPDFSHVISQDGSRIFWTDLKSGNLYVRENGSSTVPVSKGAARFWTATPNGRYAFYTEGEKLWRFDVQSEAQEELAGVGLEGESAGVRGVIGINETGEDGSYLYFVANGILASNENANKETAKAGKEKGEPNLYLRHAGETTFIATLAPEGPEGDEGTALYAAGRGSFGDWEPGLGHRTAEVTPDGRSLVFQSVRPLTGYDSGNGEGRPLAEVFVYDSEPGGGLFCASCDRSGEAPPVTEVEVAGVPVKIKAAAYLPVSWSRTYMPRFVSEDGGRVFFDSFEPLVAADPNGQQDVYEWERDGEGTCAESAGCDHLLSGGTSRSASYLVDASANGNDVFFVSDAKLVPQDDNESEHLYDDRVGGAQPSSPAGCAGLACVETPIAPPIFAAPPSATFAGVGNFPLPVPPTMCKKGYVQKQNRCVKKKTKKAKRARKAHKSRRRRS